MTNNIIKFPIKSAREWSSITKTMSDLIIESGLSNEHADEFISIFKPIYDSFMFEYSLKVLDEANNIKEEIEKYQIALQEHTNKLILDRFKRELALFISEKLQK